jgi:hypothetical protein
MRHGTPKWNLWVIMDELLYIRSDKQVNDNLFLDILTVIGQLSTR